MAAPSLSPPAVPWLSPGSGQYYRTLLSRFRSSWSSSAVGNGPRQSPAQPSSAATSAPTGLLWIGSLSASSCGEHPQQGLISGVSFSISTCRVSPLGFQNHFHTRVCTELQPPQEAGTEESSFSNDNLTWFRFLVLHVISRNNI